MTDEGRKACEEVEAMMESGDAELSSHEEDDEMHDVIGPHWLASPAYSERQDMVMQFCDRHGLVHGPPHVSADALARWTRKEWGVNATRSCLDK